MTKVSTMPARNNVQNVTLCQVPGPGVGQIQKGGEKRVLSIREFSVMPTIRPPTKTECV